MSRIPRAQHPVIFETSVFSWRVRFFAYELNRDSSFRRAGHREADGITGALSRQSRTRFRVSQVARFKFEICQRRVLLPWSVAAPPPCRAEGQACRMWESKIIDALGWMKKRTGQHHLLEVRDDCTQNWPVMFL